MDQVIQDALREADLTVTCHLWLRGDDQPGKAVEVYGRCPVCRQDWSLCAKERRGPCQLMGVMGGYNAAVHNWLIQLTSWPIPDFGRIL